MKIQSANSMIDTLNHKRNGRVFNFSRYLILEVGEVLYADTLEPYWKCEDRGTNYWYTKLYPDEPFKDAKGRKKRLKFWIARLVKEAFNGEIGNDPITGRPMEVDHQDGMPQVNHESKLIILTHAQNAALKKQRENNLFRGKNHKNTKKITKRQQGEKGVLDFGGAK